MSVRPRSQRAPAQRKRAEKFVEKAFTDEIQLKAAMLVIHRVARTMVAENSAELLRQREAIDQLMKFADAHPLPSNLESQL